MTARAEEGAVDRDAPGSGPARRSRARLLLRLACGLGLVWGVAAVACTLLGAQAARAGAERVRELDLGLGVGELIDDDVDGELSAAHDEFVEADRLLGNPVLTPVRTFPVVGRQLRSARALAGTAADVLGSSMSALRALREEIEGGGPTGSARVRSLARLGSELRTIDQVLATVDLGPSEALVGPLQRAREDVDVKLDDARTRIADVRAIVDGMHAILDGPTRYLVLASNNAEMRIGSGMFLSAGTMDIDEGSVTVSQGFEPAGDLVLPEPLALPEEMSQLWGWSDLGSDFRSLGLSARFPVNAPIGARMWTALGRGEVDGALAIDVEGVATMLRIAGPVEVDGRRIDADGVARFLLRDQYEDQALDDLAANDERRDRLRVLAGAALERFGSAEFDLRTLVEELRAARDGRHLMAWSSDPEVQKAWEAMGVDGDLRANSMLVGLANFDTSKLDPFIDVTVRPDVRREGRAAIVDLQIEIRNGSPEGLPEYVTGADGGADYLGVVAAHLPAQVTEVELDGFQGIAAAGRDGPTVVIAARVSVPRGEVRSGNLRFKVGANELGDVRIETSARIPAVRWDFGDGPRPDDSQLDWSPHVP